MTEWIVRMTMEVRVAAESAQEALERSSVPGTAASVVGIEVQRAPDRRLPTGWPE